MSGLDNRAKSGNGEEKANRTSAFGVLVVVLTAIGILGLVACVTFFIVNQFTINRAFQDMNKNSVLVEMGRAQYIKDLSEAQSSASTRDIVSLLYGFLSTAFITVGLHFMRESKQAADDAKKITQIAEDKQKSLEAKVSDIDESWKEIQQHITALQKKHEAQSKTLTLQVYIDNATACFHMLEDTLSSTLKGEAKSDGVKRAYRYFPRIRDSLFWASKTLEAVRKEECVTFFSDNHIELQLRGVTEIKNCLEALETICKKSPELALFNEQWREYQGYCETIHSSLREIKENLSGAHKQDEAKM